MELNEMIDNVEYIRNSLDSVRQVVKESNERVRAAGKQKGYDDEDTPMYDGMNKQYGITEVKKRRGVSLVDRALALLENQSVNQVE